MFLNNIARVHVYNMYFIHPSNCLVNALSLVADFLSPASSVEKVTVAGGPSPTLFDAVTLQVWSVTGVSPLTITLSAEVTTGPITTSFTRFRQVAVYM